MELDKLSIKFMWNKKVRVAKKSLRKKIYKGGLALRNIKIYYKVTLIRTVWYSCIARPVQKKKGQK